MKLLYKILVVECIILLFGYKNYAQYCESSASNGDFEFINHVVVGTINNASSSSLYADYTEVFSTNMYVGETYRITITNASHDPVDQIACWIDWNQNEVFESNEEITLEYNGLNSLESDAKGDITPPADASIGQTRMRVMLIADTPPEPCAEFVYGEVEDYTINIQAIDAPPVAEFSVNKDEIFTGGSVEFTDISTMVPTAWNWVFSPSTVTFIESTNENSMNPVVTFNEAGDYSITLEVINAIGTDDTTYTDFITVKPFSIPRYMSAETEAKHVDLSWSAPNINSNQTYVQVEDAEYSTSAGPERLVRFTEDDLNFTYPVIVTDLASYFYENLYSPWDNDYFKFKIYDSDSTTVLYESEEIVAYHGAEIKHALPNPMEFNKEFYVSVVPLGNNEGLHTPSNYAMLVEAHTTHTFIGSPGNWEEFSNDELTLEVATSIYIAGDKSSNNKVGYLGDYEFKSVERKSDDQIEYTLKGYKLYRNGNLLKEINDPETTDYRDNNLDNGEYEYHMKAIYSPRGESPESDTVTVTVDNTDPEIMVLYDGSELENNTIFELGHNVDVEESIKIGIYNEGASNLIIDTIKLDHEEFTLEAMPSKTISGGDTVYFNVLFKYTSEGPKTVNIIIENNDTNENPTTITLNAVGGLDQWTWMLYLLEDDQGLDGLKDINEWEVNGSVQGLVNYIVFYNSNTDANDGIWYVKKDENGYNRTLVSDKVSSYPGVDPDMGDPNTLEEFILWTKDNYPAQHYGLTMWDHGSGIFKSNDESKGISKGFVDDMKLWEMSEALETFVNTTKQKIDVIGFDVCLLGQFETVYQFKDLANYVIASELTEPGDGWDYTTGFEPMTSNPYITPEEIAINITNTFVESYQQGGSQGRAASTQAATSVSTMNDEFVPEFNELSDRLAEISFDYKSEIAKCMNDAWTTVSLSSGYEDNPNHRDLGGFLQNLSKSEKLPAYVTEKANKAFEIYTDMVVAEGHTEDAYTDGATGLKIWMPANISKQGMLKIYYTNPEMYLKVGLTQWDEFLTEFEEPTNSEAAVPEFYVNDTVEKKVTVNFINKSYHGATGYEWGITPSTFEYINGTGKDSKNPQVKFKELGKYTISLKASNSYGSNILTINDCVEVIDPQFDTPENLIYTQDTSIITLSWSAASGTALLDQRFEELSVWPPEGWVIASNDNLDGSNLDGLSDSTNTWGLCDENTFGDGGEQYIYSGIYSTAIGYTAGSTGDPFNWLVTPEVTLRSDDELSFWMWYASDETYYTDFDVMIFSEEQWTSLLHLTNGSGLNLYEEQVLISLNAYAGKTVKFAFVYQYTDGYQMAIDDILVNTSGSKSNRSREFSNSIPIKQNKTKTTNVVKQKIGGHIASAYNIYRNDELIHTISDLSVLTYTDTVYENGTYEYYVTKEFSNPDGESDPSNSVTVTVDHFTEITGLGDFLSAEFRLYPNPASSYCTVESDYQDLREIKIIDVSGRIRASVIVNGKTEKINISELETGIYTVQIVTEKQKINRRLIIK